MHLSPRQTNAIKIMNATTYTAAGVKLPTITPEERQAWEQGVISLGFIARQYNGKGDCIAFAKADTAEAAEKDLLNQVAKLTKVGVLCVEALRTVKEEVENTYGARALESNPQGSKARKMLRAGRVTPSQVVKAC
jgi:hypothetical protein